MNYFKISIGNLLLIVFGGCSTISGKHEIISISTKDKVTTKVRVKDDADIQEVEVPAFLKIRRSSEFLIFSPKSPVKKYGEMTTVLCAFRWRTLFLGNGIPAGVFSLTSPVAGVLALGGFIAVDLFTGAGYECPEHVSIGKGLKTSGMAFRTNCRRMVVLPLENDDELVSEELAKYWIEQKRKSLGSCDKIIDFDRSKEFLQAIEVDHTYEPSWDSFSAYKLGLLGFNLGATHLVKLRYIEARPGNYYLKPDFFSLYDRQPLAQMEPPALQAPLSVVEKGRSFPGPSERHWGPYFLRFLPNSLSFFPYVNSDFTNDLIVDGTVEEVDRSEKRRLPSYLTSWTLSSVSSSMAHDTWDYALSLQPSFSTFYQNSTIHYKNIGTSDPTIKSYSIEAYYLSSHLEGIGELITPLGTVSAYYGLGLAYTNFSEEDRRNVHFLSPVMCFGVGYSLFFNEKIFGTVDVVSYTFTKPLVQNDFVKINGWNMISVGIGYYFPSARSIARKVWD